MSAETEELSPVSSISSLPSSHEHSINDRHIPVPMVSKVEPAGDHNVEPVALEKTKTTASTLTDKTLQRPRKERRGLLAQLTLVPEFRDARDYPMALKSFIVFIIAVAGLIGPMGTSIVFPAIGDMTEDLNTTTSMVNVSVGIYLLSLGVFPLWWSNFSERIGRRSVYILSFSMYIGFAIGAALSSSIQMLIAFRVLTGACSASVQAVGAGTISDLFVPEQRGRAMGYFYLGSLVSPLISPIVGSLLLISWDWRSTQWFCMALAAVLDMLLIFFLPETLREQITREAIAKVLEERRLNKEADDSSKTEDEENAISRISSRVSRATEQGNVESLYGNEECVDPVQLKETEEADLRRMETRLEESINDLHASKWALFKKNFYEIGIRPLKAVYFLQYPPVSLSVSFSSLTFATLYLVNMTLEYEFSRSPYNWGSLYVGLAYIPNSVAYIIASIYGGKWTDKLLRDYIKKHGFGAAEARISYNMVSAVVCYPIALLIIGWCFHFHTFWVTPLIGTTLFGYATMMTIGPTVTYLVDSLPGRGATGVAVNNLCRQTMATAAVFLVDPMITGMGVGPMLSMCAGVVVLWSVVLYILKKRGRYWRENYDLQALYDKLE